MFFNEQGMLNLDEAVMNQPTFKKIMEDGIVTEQEIKEQSERIVSILKSMEKNGSSSNLVVISFLFQLSSSFLILLKVVDMFAF